MVVLNWYDNPVHTSCACSVVWAHREVVKTMTMPEAVVCDAEMQQVG